jgi:hypothetical protein
MEYRTLGRDDVERVWTIDRSERIERSYRYAGGRLHLEPLVVDVPGFPESTLTTMTPQLYACVDGGGVLYGASTAARSSGRPRSAPPASARGATCCNS